MKLTREQKALIAVLGVALTACLADRLFVMEPATASADTTTLSRAPARPAVKPTVAAATIARAAEPEISIFERLKSSGAAKQPIECDPFALDKWTTSASAPQVNAAEVFRKGHSLGGVMVSRNGVSRALVDGRWIEAGEVVDGYKLVSVTHTSATFHAGESKLVLVVPGLDGRSAE